MLFSIRPYRRFPVQCAVIYNFEPFLKLKLGYLFGFGALIACLFLSNSPAYAEWVKFSDGDRGTLYTDASTLRRYGNLARMWELINFQALQASRHPYFSMKVVREYDCTVEQIRIIALYVYSGQMGTGKMVDSDEQERVKWKPVMPDSLEHGLWEFACGKK
jgi:hypothetical protein